MIYSPALIFTQRQFEFEQKSKLHDPRDSALESITWDSMMAEKLLKSMITGDWDVPDYLLPFMGVVEEGIAWVPFHAHHILNDCSQQISRDNAELSKILG